MPTLSPQLRVHTVTGSGDAKAHVPGMRVIPPAATTRRLSAEAARRSRVELFALAASSIVIASGLFLTYLGRIHPFSTLATDLSTGNVINISQLKDASQLASRLTMFDVPFERQAVARALYQRAASAITPLDHIGDLAAVTIPASDIRKDPRFVELRARLNRRPDVEQVAVLSSVELATLKSRAIVRTPAEFSATLRLAAMLFFGAFWGAHLVRRWRGIDDDPLMLPILSMLSGVGLMAMVGLRDPLRDTIVAYPFALGVAGGLVALVAASQIDFQASPLRKTVALPLLLALGLAALLLLLGSGPGSSGAKVNLFGFQPVEAIRMLVVFALSAYFAARLEFLRELSEPATASRPWFRYVQLPRWKDIGPVLISMSIVLAFFFLQKDLGPALVLSILFLTLYGVARGRITFVAVGLSMLFSAFLAAYWLGFPSVVRQRVAMWLDPWRNGAPGGDQVAHGLWALASGALFGAGPGLGDPQLIPAGHTDFVLAAVGEDLGFLGLFAVIVLYGLLCWRCLRVARRAPGDYTAFLSVGIALALTLQALVIGGGLLGLLPLSGVVTPFLSYGRSSMLANFAAVGIVLAIARRAGPTREHLVGPFRVLAGALAMAGVAIVGRTAWIQVVKADSLTAAATLAEQADGAYRFQYNPRLIAAARVVPRGTISDRNGLVLATSRSEEIRSIVSSYRDAGIQPPEPCAASAVRCYPLGGIAFHLVGDATSQTNWGARNSSFLERDNEAALRGFDDRVKAVEVRNPRTGRIEHALQRDYRDLVPLLRDQYRPNSAALATFLARDRNVRSSIDARLQVRAASALRRGIESGGYARGAAVVLDVESGEVLASVTYPWPHSEDLRQRDGTANDAAADDRLLDRPRYGLYPPGSTFKLLVAAAALRSSHDSTTDTFSCVRLPDGRVGNYVAGSARPIRDDPLDTLPHGSVDLRRGLVMSCNAYFAQLAMRLGPQPLLDAASLFDIDLCRPATSASLRHTLAQAGYGQGQVVVSPVKMARLAATVARQGRVAPARWTLGEPSFGGEDAQLLTPVDAALLSRYMREVVTSGTGRTLAGNVTPIAGKTGTAEVDGGKAHSWFAGFAPYGERAPRKIAFAVLVENAGYGARAAAPVAGALVDAARDLGIIK